MEEPVLLASDEGPVRTLTFNRPDAHNAISSELLAALGEALTAAEADPAVRALILTGRGRMFSAGGNLDKLTRPQTDAELEIENAAIFASLKIIRQLAEFAKPTLAMVNGPVAGGGLALALACDLRIAADRAKFVYAYGTIGLAGDFGVNWLLGRLLAPGHALSFALSPGFTAEAALRTGLVDAVAEPGTLADACLARAKELTAIPLPAYMQIRRNLEASALSFDDGTRIETEAFLALRRTEEHRSAVAALAARMEQARAARQAGRSAAG